MDFINIFIIMYKIQINTCFFSGGNFPNQKIKALCISGSSIIKDTLEPISPCGAFKHLC